MDSPITRLIKQLTTLPGIGEKTAERLAYSLIERDRESVEDLARAIVDAKDKVVKCKKCNNYSYSEICEICSNPDRDHSIICVVEFPRDVMAMEKAEGYNGLYHVLYGALSSMREVRGVRQNIEHLVRRVEEDKIREVVVATSINVPGEITANFIKELLPEIRVTRIGYGIPVGGEIDFYDSLTIKTALQNRKEI